MDKKKATDPEEESIKFAALPALVAEIRKNFDKLMGDSLNVQEAITKLGIDRFTVQTNFSPKLAVDLFYLYLRKRLKVYN